jgi:hypothetical protein
MSKKLSHGRRRQDTLTTYRFSARTWNYLRAQVGWPETGEPVPYAACLQWRDQLADTGDAGELCVLLALVCEGWRQSHPHAPQAVTMHG